MRARFLLLLTVLGLTATHAAKADDYRYPAGTPVLSLTLPEGWTENEQDGPAKLLICSPPGDATYFISVMSLPTVGSKADLKDILARITRAGATGASLTGITVSEPVEETVGTGLRQFTRITAAGKHDDEDSAFTYYAFSLPETGKFYAVGVAGLKAMIDAHRADFEAVAASITAVR